MRVDTGMGDPEVATTSPIDFYFDPGCPWTWATSRWLVEAATQRGTEIVWRSLSLAMLNAGREVPEQYIKLMEVVAQAHRVFAALDEGGRNDLLGAVYTEYGRRVHHDGETPTADLVREIVVDAGAGDYLDALGEQRWDASVEASTNEAVALAGPDVGSPVLAFGTPRFGVFGPIVSPPPTGDDALRLLDLVLASADVPGFFEVKRGRDEEPAFGPRP